MQTFEPLARLILRVKPARRASRTSGGVTYQRVPVPDCQRAVLAPTCSSGHTVAYAIVLHIPPAMVRGAASHGGCNRPSPQHQHLQLYKTTRVVSNCSLNKAWVPRLRSGLRRSYAFTSNRTSEYSSSSPWLFPPRHSARQLPAFHLVYLALPLSIRAAGAYVTLTVTTRHTARLRL